MEGRRRSEEAEREGRECLPEWRVVRVGVVAGGAGNSTGAAARREEGEGKDGDLRAVRSRWREAGRDLRMSTGRAERSSEGRPRETALRNATVRAQVSNFRSPVIARIMNLLSASTNAHILIK